MSDDIEWVHPSDELCEQVQRDCLRAAIEAIGDVDLNANEDVGPKIAAILRACVAVHETQKKASKAWINGRENVHSVFVDELHIVATAVLASSDVLDIDDYHPYTTLAGPLIAFASAAVMLEGLSMASVDLEEVSIATYLAKDALALLNRNSK
jgi:hypothetical protein